MKRDKLIDKSRVVFYLWVGLAYLVILSIHNLTSLTETFGPRLVNNIWRTLYIVIVNYIFFEITVPFVLRKRSYLVYNILLGVALLWVHLMFWSYGLYSWRGLGMAIGFYTPYVAAGEEESMVATQMAFSAGSVVFFGLIIHIFNYTKLKQSAQQLRIEKQQAELSFLKSQTNPHFLFNTLNNIYSLAKDKSNLAPESIMRLSKILRFMLYETGGQFISVEQELQIINDYVELEKLRYDETLQVNFNYDIEDMKQALPPLLLIPLVENAFKHGVSESRTRPFINIHLSIRHRQLTFIVKNSAESATEEKVNERIGLSNLRRQLELLYKEYKLGVQHNGATFTAELKINLASHV